MKIGAAIIACNRFDYTKKCIESVLDNRGPLNEIIIVNDGEALNFNVSVDVILNIPPYQSVGVAKNNAINELLKRGCDHIFLIENDQIIKSSEVWEKYINAAEITGILHLNFGYHGPANRTSDYKSPNPRLVVDYGNVKIALNPNSVGAFSYFNKRFIQEVGIHDEFFKNAWEHVELCQRAITKGLLPAFWWFPDVEGSDNYITEVEGSIQNSSITHTETWTDNMKKGAEYYKKLHGHVPVHSPDTPLNIVKEKLVNIYNKYKCK